MPGDLLPAAQDHHRLDEALHQHGLEAIGRRHRVVVAAVAHQRCRRNPRRPLLARLQRHRRQLPQSRDIGGQPLADRLGVPAGTLRLPRAGSARASMALSASKLAATGIGVMKLAPRILHQPLDLPLVVALARAAEPILEQIMADQFGERPGALPLAVAADLRHRDLEVVVEDRQRHAAEEARTPTTCPSRNASVVSARIGLHEAGVRLRQVQAEEMDLLPHAADHPHRLAEIHLRMARRVRQRHERLPPTRPARAEHSPSPPCSRRHTRVRRAAARISASPCDAASPAPLRSASRIASITGISGPSFGFTAGLRPYVAGRQREPAHLRHRLAAQTKHPSRLAPAVAIAENKPTNRCIDLHGKHPRPTPKQSAYQRPGFTPPRSAQCRRSSGWVCHRRAHRRPSPPPALVGPQP